MLRFVLILFIFTGFKSSPRFSKVSEKIIEFSLQNLGKKVDTGECWDLANKALTYADADWQPPFKFGTKLDYPKQELKPADILQFTNIKLKFPNGSMSFPKHTAIVYKAKGKQVTLLQQNFNNKKYVDTLTISMDYIKSGKVEAYRPKAKNG